ncbi:MAG: hypothetical protein K0R67_2244 [Paenibacillus sp.]|nr:hypothetical protein [Paenibacillus sp.]
MERYPRGRRGRFAKALGCNSRKGSNPFLSVPIQAAAAAVFFVVFLESLGFREEDRRVFTFLCGLVKEYKFLGWFWAKYMASPTW